MKISEIVEEALSRAPEEREAYLSLIADTELRQRARRLLAVTPTQLDRIEGRVIRQPSRISIPDGNRIGHYRIERFLDYGGMGAVYLARDEKNERLVALKLIPPEKLRFSEDEHRALARLSNSGIATLFDSGTTEDGFRYVAMEYVDGLTISDYSEKHCPTLRSRLELFAQVCDAVSYAHQQLVAHRDIKPGNILVTVEGKPKLLDFGIAKLLSPEAADLALTTTSERPKTLAFASPEQIAGEVTAAASDIYSLGVLLSLLVSGRLPYKAKSVHDLITAILEREAEKPSELVVLRPTDLPAAGPAIPEGPLPPEESREALRKLLKGDVDAIVLKALRKRPEERYSSVAELADDIRRYLSEMPVLARRGSQAYRIRKFLRRHRLWTAAAVVGLLFAVIFLGALARERNRVRQEAERAEELASFLVDMYRSPTLWDGSGENVSAREILDNGLGKLRDASARDPATQRTLSRSLAAIYLNLGLYTPAETLLDASLGDESLEGETLLGLARVKYFHGCYREAEEYAQRAMASERAVDSDLEVGSLTILGQAALALGDYRRAEELLREVLERRRVEGNKGSQAALARAKNDLGAVLHEQGRFEEAERLYRDALAIRRRELVSFHPDVLQSLYNLARLATDRNDFAQARMLFAEITSLQGKAFIEYDPRLAVIRQGYAALAIEEGRYSQAEVQTSSTHEFRRRQLQDSHPDIGRSLGELGRVAQREGRSRQAEAYYQGALSRLEKSLGKQHPDVIAVENNLAALRAEQGKYQEAKALWQGLLGGLGNRLLRPHLRRAIRENLKALKAQGRDSAVVESRYTLLGTSASYLSELTPEPSVQGGLRERMEPGKKPVVLFVDDFEDGEIDLRLWEYGGRRVVEEGGELRVELSETDHGGWIRSLPIAIDGTRPVRITKRTKVHAANSYFNGALYVDIVGFPQRRFGVSYGNFDYRSGTIKGFFVFRQDANPPRASPFVPPIWDEWFSEELVYDPVTGEVSYSINGKQEAVYSVGVLPPGASSISVSLGAWGWYTGHKQCSANIAISQ